MKRLKSLLIATVLFLGASQTINAQAKTAHVDVNEIISQNKYRTPKALFTNNNDGDLISLYGAYDESDEAQFIVERAIILQLTLALQTQYLPSHFA